MKKVLTDDWSETSETQSQLTFPLLCRVGQQRSGQDMHAVLVEKAEELRLLRFLGNSSKDSFLFHKISVENYAEKQR